MFSAEHINYPRGSDLAPHRDLGRLIPGNPTYYTRRGSKGMASHKLQRSVRVAGWDECHKAPLIRQVERIEPKNLASTLHWLINLDFAFGNIYMHGAGFRDFD